MGTYISGHAGTSKNSFTIGDGNDGYKSIYMDNDLGYTAGIRFNDTDELWELSSDGSSWNQMAVGGGSAGQLLTVSGGFLTWSSDISLSNTGSRLINVAQAVDDTDGKDLVVSAGMYGNLSSLESTSGGSLHLDGGDGYGLDGYGGAVIIIPGENSYLGRNGNIFLQESPYNTQCNNMENGIYVGEATNVPDGYDDLGGSGGYLYSESGAIIWKSGVSGTETTMGPGCPHCPRCNRDFATSWKNNEETLSLCMWCLTEALIDVGLDQKFIIKKS